MKKLPFAHNMWNSWNIQKNAIVYRRICSIKIVCYCNMITNSAWGTADKLSQVISNFLYPVWRITFPYQRSQPKLLYYTWYNQSIFSFRSETFRSLLTPSSMRPVSPSVLRNVSKECQRLLTFRYKIEYFQHSRTVANVINVPAVMWMSNETVKI